MEDDKLEEEVIEESTEEEVKTEDKVEETKEEKIEEEDIKLDKELIDLLKRVLPMIEVLYNAHNEMKMKEEESNYEPQKITFR